MLLVEADTIPSEVLFSPTQATREVPSVIQTPSARHYSTKPSRGPFYMHHPIVDVSTSVGISESPCGSAKHGPLPRKQPLYGWALHPLIDSILTRVFYLHPQFNQSFVEECLPRRRLRLSHLLLSSISLTAPERVAEHACNRSDHSSSAPPSTFGCLETRLQHVCLLCSFVWRPTAICQILEPGLKVS